MSTTIPKHFDAETRNQFAQAQEIQIETRRPEANVPPLRRTIWVVVAGEEVFLRSVRGTRAAGIKPSRPTQSPWSPSMGNRSRCRPCR